MAEGDMIALRYHYTTAQLIEELARRANQHETKKPRKWCEDCRRFLTWNDGPTPMLPMPESYNACSAGHAMKFVAPEGYGDEYGFYRTVCADRVEITDAREDKAL